MTTAHQIASSLAYGDAITNHVLALDAALRDWGYTSRIYAERVEPRLQALAQPDAAYLPAIERSDDILIYHYSAYSPNTQLYQRSRNRRLLVYHNITPAEYLTAYDADLAAICRLGRDALPQLGDADLAVGVSETNRRELLAAGFDAHRVVALPILLNLAAWDATPPNPRLTGRLSDGRVNVLFVGRVVPNKAFEDVIKIFAAYRRAIQPDARLALVGSRVLPRYSAVLDRLVERLGLGDAVTFTDRVPLADLRAYYETAHVFLSASRHEGFCVPLLESMRFGVPILAYAAAAVPETLGASGVVYRAFDYPLLAEALHLLATDRATREAIIAGQRARLADFAPPRVAGQWRLALDQVATAPPAARAAMLGERRASR